MSTPDNDAAPVSLRRADFLAVLWASLGVFWLVGALGDGAPNALLSSNTFYLAIGLFWLGGAVFYRRRPDSVRRGREPTPTLWLGLGGALIGALALIFVVVIVL